jgi:L-fucose isomerase-like protein
VNEGILNTYRIAFIPLLRMTFDVVYAKQMIMHARASLIKAGFEIIETDEPISNIETAKKASTFLKDRPVDALVIFQATFADSTLLSNALEFSAAPVYVWAVPEPWTGNRLRLNSLCGINLAAHAMSLQGIKFEYGYGAPDDQEIIKDINILSAAGALKRKLTHAKLGVIGEHPEGFDSCHLDKEKLISFFGVQVEQIPLEVVFQGARAIPLASVKSVRKVLDDQLDNLSTLDQDALEGTLRVYLAMSEIASERGLDGLAVRCWPEFFTTLKCAACGAMSMLSDGFLNQIPLPCSCEADINGTLSQLILQWLSGEPAFGTDIVGVEKNQDLVALWHCGLAPLSMADPSHQPHGTIHSNRRLPLLMDFPLKPGKVTITRINQYQDSFRLVIGSGEMISGEKPFSGTSGILKPSCSAQHFLDTLIYEGLEHHISLTYGQYSRELQKFAELVGLPYMYLGKEEQSD